MLDLTAARGLDALTFTSAPAAASVPGPRRDARLLPEVLGALRHDIVVACVGPVTALSRSGPEHPDPPAGTLPPRPPRPAPLRPTPSTARVLPIGGHRVEIRGHAVLVDDELRAVPPAGIALLHVLARRPGWVVARADLLRALPGSGTDEHAVETAMARLRSALGAPRLIQRRSNAATGWRWTPRRTRSTDGEAAASRRGGAPGAYVRRSGRAASYDGGGGGSHAARERCATVAASPTG
ncbi:hypothetical protein SCALM49S_04648 [Streptomyces californicus]